jgi:hypothetical protein
MSDRWFIPGLFGVQATTIFWDPLQQAQLHLGSPIFFEKEDFSPAHLRWMVSPSIGLSIHPFQVFVGKPPVDDINMTTQSLIDTADWRLVEVVGLPVDDKDPNWANIYDVSPQGLVNQKFPPLEASLRRLLRGAPRIGWDVLDHRGSFLPTWEPPDLEAYLKELIGSQLWHGLEVMLTEHKNPLEHAAFDVTEENPASPLAPRLFATRGSSAWKQPAKVKWQPMGLLALSALSDPFASLALGFGTALEANPGDAVMVTVLYEFDFTGRGFIVELADAVILDSKLGPPDPPVGFTAISLSHDRPVLIDGPAIESVRATWGRPARPDDMQTGSPSSAYPASYVLARFGPQHAEADILLERRVSGGWQPFAASRPTAGKDRPVGFTDHVLRATTIGVPPLGKWQQVDLIYAVAAQDLFGRWSKWETVNLSLEEEPEQGPALLQAALDPSGALSVDFAWDWSERSPEFIELSGTFEDSPAVEVFNALLNFRGAAQPDVPIGKAVVHPLVLSPSDFEVPRLLHPQIPVPKTLGPTDPADQFGRNQDRDPQDPGMRYYRLEAQIAFSFAGRTDRTLLVKARGQCHIHQIILPGSKISAFSPPVRVQLFDPQPPALPEVEAPQWASLPDVNGVSRASLTWKVVDGADGYVVYEATETTLLAALHMPGPDPAEPLFDRLSRLRKNDLSKLQNRFRRMEPGLITDTHYEAALPRGSSILHFYVVTAMTHNQIESVWPTEPKSFMAVAIPHLVVPGTPGLQATPDPQSGTVQLHVQAAGGILAESVQLYRTTNPMVADGGGDGFGPPVSPRLPLNAGSLTFVDVAAPAGWRRIIYRALAWAADDNLTGAVGARSPSSAPISVLLPPADPPDLSDLQVNILPGSTTAVSLVGWSSRAPVANTDMGPHAAAIETHDAQRKLLHRFSDDLQNLPAIPGLAELPAPDSASLSIARLDGNPAGQPVHYLAWAPRPADGSPFSITVKIIDPLGRITAADVPVPSLSTLPPPQLGPLQILPVGPLEGFQEWMLVRWQVLSAVDPALAGNYTFGLGVVPSDPLAQPAHCQAAFSDIQISSATFRRLVQTHATDKILRRPGDQAPFDCVFLFQIVHGQVTVNMTDPLGRTDMQTAAF